MQTQNASNAAYSLVQYHTTDETRIDYTSNGVQSVPQQTNPRVMTLSSPTTEDCEREPSDAESLHDNFSSDESNGDRRVQPLKTFKYRKSLIVEFKLQQDDGQPALLVDFKQLCIDKYGVEFISEEPISTAAPNLQSTDDDGMLCATSLTTTDTTATSIGTDSSTGQTSSLIPPLKGHTVEDPLGRAIRLMQIRLCKQGTLVDPRRLYEGDEPYDADDPWLDDSELFDTFGIKKGEMDEVSSRSDSIEIEGECFYDYDDPSAFCFDNNPENDNPLPPAEPEGAEESSISPMGVDSARPGDHPSTAIDVDEDESSSSNLLEFIDPPAWRRVRHQLPKHIISWFELLEASLDNMLIKQEEVGTESLRLFFRKEVSNLFDKIHKMSPSDTILQPDAKITHYMYKGCRRVTSALTLPDILMWWNENLKNHNEQVYKTQKRIITSNIKMSSILNPSSDTNGEISMAAIDDIKKCIAEWQNASSPPIPTTVTPLSNVTQTIPPETNIQCSPPTVSVSTDVSPVCLNTSIVTPTPIVVTTTKISSLRNCISLDAVANHLKSLMILFNNWKHFLRSLTSSDTLRVLSSDSLLALPASCFDMANSKLLKYLDAIYCCDKFIPRKFFEEYFKLKYGKYQFRIKKLAVTSNTNKQFRNPTAPTH